MPIDYKDWIQNKAADLATEQYNADYWDLDEYTQHLLDLAAAEAYQDYLATQVDAMNDRIKESGLYGIDT